MPPPAGGMSKEAEKAAREAEKAMVNQIAAQVKQAGSSQWAEYKQEPSMECLSGCICPCMTIYQVWEWYAMDNGMLAAVCMGVTRVPWNCPINWQLWVLSHILTSIEIILFRNATAEKFGLKVPPMDWLKSCFCCCFLFQQDVQSLQLNLQPPADMVGGAIGAAAAGIMGAMGMGWWGAQQGQQQMGQPQPMPMMQAPMGAQPGQVIMVQQPNGMQSPMVVQPNGMMVPAQPMQPQPMQPGMQPQPMYQQPPPNYNNNNQPPQKQGP